jgi:hypothetical protein
MSIEECGRKCKVYNVDGNQTSNETNYLLQKEKNWACCTWNLFDFVLVFGTSLIFLRYCLYLLVDLKQDFGVDYPNAQFYVLNLVLYYGFLSRLQKFVNGISVIIFFNGSSREFRALASYSVPLSFFADGRTPWTSDQPVARPLRTQRTTQTQNKRIHPRLDWDSNPWSQRSRERS